VEVKRIGKEDTSTSSSSATVADTVTTPPNPSSGLSLLIQKNQKDFSGASNKGKLRLSIYLPDFSDMRVYAITDCTVGELIRIILRQHESEEILPSLEYNNPFLYELRMHEGDGEPDRDFPAYNTEQLLRNIESDEFCLCEKENNANAFRTFSVNDSLFSSVPPTMTPLTSSDKSKGSGPGGPLTDKIRDRDRGYEGVFSRYDGSRVKGRDDDDDDDDDDDAGVLASSLPPPKLENLVTVKFPDGQSLQLEHEENSTLRDLIPVIAKQLRLRLVLSSPSLVLCLIIFFTVGRVFTDEYEFLISPQDQKLFSVSYEPHFHFLYALLSDLVYVSTDGY
jgi:hypothetical protein